MSYPYILMLLTISFIILLAVVAFTDFKTKKIPNKVILTLLGITILKLAFGSFSDQVASTTSEIFLPYPLANIVAAFVVVLPLFIIALITHGKLGMGDVKLCFVCSLWCGYPGCLYGLFFGIVIAAIVVFLGLLSKRLTSKSVIALGPYLCIGYAIAMFVK